MSRALVLLICFRQVGVWRNYWRRGWESIIAIVGKALIILYMMIIVMGWVIGVVFALLRPQDDPIRTEIRSFVAGYGRLSPIPLFLLLVLVAVFAVFERPFRLHPAEVDFIQAGPFSRRQLLTYKMGAGLLGPLLLTLLGAPLATAAFPFLSCFVGLFLLLSFVYLFQLVVGSVGTLVGLRGANGLLVRLVLPLALFGAACALVWFSFGKLRNDPVALYRQVTESPGWRLALTPLRGFVEVIMAQRVWPDLIQWALPCLAVEGALVGAIYALDVRLELVEDEAEERAVEAAPAAEAAAPPRWSLPLSRVGGGAGVLAWRQAINVIRGPHQIGFALFAHGFTLFVFYTFIRQCPGLLFLPTLDGHVEINPAGGSLCAGLALLMPMLIAWGLSFDFRGDFGRMDVLKALPIAPLAVVAGQLFVPVVIATAMQWALMTTIALGLRSVPSGLWVAAVFAPPISVVWMAIENLPSFWFPLRQTPGCAPEPFEAIGHVLLHPLVRIVCYAVATGATALAAAVAFFLFGASIVAAIVAAWLTIVATGAGLVVLLARTFDWFDTTQDTTP